MNEHCRDTTHVLDMFELSKAMLEISQTGFYDLKSNNKYTNKLIFTIFSNSI